MALCRQWVMSRVVLKGLGTRSVWSRGDSREREATKCGMVVSWLRDTEFVRVCLIVRWELLIWRWGFSKEVCCVMGSG